MIPHPRISSPIHDVGQSAQMHAQSSTTHNPSLSSTLAGRHGGAPRAQQAQCSVNIADDMATAKPPAGAWLVSNCLEPGNVAMELPLLDEVAEYQQQDPNAYKNTAGPVYWLEAWAMHSVSALEAFMCAPNLGHAAASARVCRCRQRQWGKYPILQKRHGKRRRGWLPTQAHPAP